MVAELVSKRVEVLVGNLASNEVRDSVARMDDLAAVWMDAILVGTKVVLKDWLGYSMVDLLDEI